MRVLAALHRFAESGEGDVKALVGREELRLRIGDYGFSLFPFHPTRLRFAACFIAVMHTGERRLAKTERHNRCLFRTLPRWGAAVPARRRRAAPLQRT